jgi:hypothetical protein
VTVTVQRLRDGRWQAMPTRSATLAADGSFQAKAPKAAQGRYRASALFLDDQGTQASSALRVFKVR